ncbi:MAG: class I mannose-6-phosphate isomerase [Spirochaetaceae bacterium]|nr:class I mannose-6-phosphate isomerase [Spirochaetaceae bacterium]
MGKLLWQRPVFFNRNRVYRVYLGGKLFHGFLGDKDEDGFHPEEWVASTVHAMNANSTGPLEGISIVEGTEIPFTQLLEEHREDCLGDRDTLGVLVKYLDSAIRLPMQVHPTRDFSKKHFGSPYGKAESWVILDTRPDACIYYGFSRQVSREEFEAAVDKSLEDKSCMTEFVNRVPVKPGDVFFVPAGVIHAIGAGCLMLEAQEPSDFTVQPEHWCGEHKLSDYEMYLGLPRETANDCFDFSRYGDDVIKKGKKQPKCISETSNTKLESLIDEDDTECFSVKRLTVSGGSAPLEEGAAVHIVAQGRGVVRCGDFVREVKKGDYFFLPVSAAAEAFVDGDVELLICKGGK